MSFALFMIVYAAICGAIACCVAIVWNYDRIAVCVLRALDAPVYEEARRIAASIYQHPDQWRITVRGYVLAHDVIGEIHFGHSPGILEVRNSTFGKWDPSVIERRIIADAVRWHRRALIRKALA